MKQDDLLFIEAQRYCWFYQTFIYVKPTSKKGVYRIAISKCGKEEIGKNEYENCISYKKITKKEGNKEVVVKEKIPAIHEKIRELYINIYKESLKN